jgi:hypothetical protein
LQQAGRRFTLKDAGFAQDVRAEPAARSAPLVEAVESEISYKTLDIFK